MRAACQPFAPLRFCTVYGIQRLLDDYRQVDAVMVGVDVHCLPLAQQAGIGLAFREDQVKPDDKDDDNNATDETIEFGFIDLVHKLPPLGSQIVTDYQTTEVAGGKRHNAGHKPGEEL